ncbi:hypothetical protein GM418_29360 [Maribellus comscasis]|uniref:YtkA-like domain-containing protein n=1 Tax=Maribellus comscasis TaxID=2681766 RepID=A0A6I6K2E8_9BACT|nr:FixH family protein [Maribellus comscasis]QGY47628.1 hypothetical protein GM418_29360 [Maribellus comscasis]
MKIKHILILFLLPIFFAACEKEEEIPEEETHLISIAKSDSESGVFSVDLMAEQTLFQGYNKLYFDIENNSDKSPVTQASVSILPMMHMTTMTHAAPFENPENTVNENGYFEGAAVFIMPGNPDEGWELRVAIDDGGIKDTTYLTIPEVTGLDEAREFSAVSEADGKTYFISLLEPSVPEVGMNDIGFTVHYRENMMSFPAAENLSISIEPEMPSMGHGSPNNVNPTHMGNGHYKGKVNFTMTGWWRVNIEISKDGEPIGNELSFDITF